MKVRLCSCLILAALAMPVSYPAGAQEQAAAATAADTGELDQAALEELVARIALYPDELIAVISAASLYPLQIVEASRFLDAYEKDKSLKPKESWDGSIVSLLNYPEIVRMMSDDLDWTQALADALAAQQKDVLIAIQQLREEALAKDIIKTDDKITVVEEDDNIVIRPSSSEVIYVPQYEPEMLYVEGATYAPITYYEDPYPYYWYPSATFFAGAAAGAIWGAAIDWDDWGIWGGRWDGDVDIDVDCDHCFNDRDFTGKIDFKDIDWANVDRSKLKFDRNQFAKADRAAIADKIKADGGNAIRDKATSIRRESAAKLPGTANKAKDIRKSTIEGLRDGPGGAALAGGAAVAGGAALAGGARLPDRPKQAAGLDGKRDVAKPGGAGSAGKAKQAAAKKKMAGKVDNRGKKPSSLGKVDRGKTAKVQSNRGQRSVSKAQRSGPRVHGGGGSRGGARGGGGRGGRR